MMRASQDQRLSRRTLLAGGGFAAAAFLTACDLSLTPDTQTQQGPKGQQAPRLEARVEAGELPPVADRLPPKPVVVTPETIGKYGGTWKSATIGAGDTAWWWRIAGYEPLVRIEPFRGEILPNVADGYEVSPDGRRFVFHLHPGIRWSDGAEFTADDLTFWYEDYLINEELLPTGPPSWMITAGEPARVSKIDEHTVQFLFPGGGNGFLPFRLSNSDGAQVTAMPRHYLERFHVRYAPDADEQARRAGQNSWVDLFIGKAGEESNFFALGLPTIRPWFLATGLGSGSEVTFDRNPYYWKTDPEGSQLPYIDTISLSVIRDAEVILLRATNGELDYHARHINLPANKPLAFDAADQAGYRVTSLSPGSMNVGVIGLNMTIKDPVKREIYRNRDFRIGLSYALNRQELIDSVLQRQGEPWQAAPQRDSRFFDEEMAKQYTEHDLDKAAEHLDRAFPKRDGEGRRLGPDGRPIVINFLASTEGGDLESLYLDLQPIMAQQWAEVGIGMTTTSMERSLFGVKSGNEEQDALMWTGFGGSDLTLPVDPRWYLPYTTSQSNWAKQWVLWNTSDGEDGEEPPDRIKQGYRLYRQALAAVEIEERDDHLRQLLKLAKEDFWVIGTISTPPSFAIVADSFRNVPDEQPDCWPYPQPGQLHSEAFWIQA